MFGGEGAQILNETSGAMRCKLTGRRSAGCGGRVVRGTVRAGIDRPMRRPSRLRREEQKRDADSQGDGANLDEVTDLARGGVVVIVMME